MMDQTIHFVLVGLHDGRCACGLRVASNTITNRWRKVTCSDCLKQKDNKNKKRPDKVTYREHLKRRRND